MFKTVKDRVWAFDAEWIPDPVAGKLLYDLPDNTPDLDVVKRMWKEGGATEEDPTPYLKTVVCRIVSVAAVDRFESGRKAKLHLLSLPRDLDDSEQVSEKNIVSTFLDKVGQYKPQLVGFNSASADLKAFIQRAVILGIQAREFCRRPNKPWEGDDYFDSRNSEASVDIKDIIGGWGKATPSLNEIATLSGIPGKLDVDGEEVAFLWLDGKLDEIVAYNEFDALTTYLVWLRVAHFGGHFTSAEYEVEQQLVKELILSEIESGKVYLKKYLEQWDRLKEIVK
jgi:predicted PolB exonuclease-like 3'-5' exonuclease